MKKIYNALGAVCLMAASFLADNSAQAQLYSFTTHTFTPAGATGRFGPTLVACQSAYSAEAWSSDLSFFNMSTQGIQEWTVPATGNYEIEAVGAQGATGGCQVGGLGASMKGTFALTEGQVILIAVGQKGQDNPGCGSNDSGPGGGGSFVVDQATMLPLVVAGGGGGGGSSGPGQAAVTTTSGTAGGGSGGAGGINGGGGGGALSGTAGDGVTPGGNGTSCSYGTGGGGFYSRGGYNCSGGAPLISGFGFIDGDAVGGEAHTAYGGTEGGFGGGGGVGHRASGGGGYSGGGGDGGSTGGGGGGSFNSGSDQVNTGGVNSGDGYVVITMLCNPMVTSVSADTVCVGEDVILHAESTIGGTISWDGGITDSVAFTIDSAGVTTYVATSDTTDCPFTVDIFVEPSPEFVLNSTDELIGGDGSAIITLSDGIFPFSYDWDNDGTGDFDDDQNQTGLTGGWYTVTVMHGNGCTATDSVEVNSQLTIKELGENVRLYPNPVAEKLNIDGMAQFNYAIIDANGKEVMSGIGGENEVLSLEKFESGVYLIRIDYDGKSQTVRLVKK